MIKLGSISYPYLAVAKHYNIPYREVLDLVRMFEIDSAYLTMVGNIPWTDATADVYIKEQERRKQVLGV